MLSSYKIIFNQKKQKVDKKGKITAGFVYTKLEQFCQWYNQEVFNEGCKYCGLTNEGSLNLYQMQRNGQRHDATRGGKRGKRLELDRRDPKLPYDDLHNIVWCCYWCNNAKSNFFSHIEFQPIAIAIGQVLRKIIIDDSSLVKQNN